MKRCRYCGTSHQSRQFLEYGGNMCCGTLQECVKSAQKPGRQTTQKRQTGTQGVPEW